MKIFLKILKWTGLVLLAGFIVLVGFRTKHIFDMEKTNAQIEKIHNTKLQMSDVMGDNLPPDPGSAADATIEGVDANANGIRDDVELAIFKEYPNSAKTRAVLLQYALALQMEVTQPFINSDIVDAVADKQDTAFFCSYEITDKNNTSPEGKALFVVDKYLGFIKDKHFNTESRKKSHKDFYDKLEGGRSDHFGCDIPLESFKN